MAKTETQKLQEYADEIWGVGKMEVTWSLNCGFNLYDLEDIRMGRGIGRNASEAHAELDSMADLKKSQRRVEECDTSPDEPRLWHVIDGQGAELFAPVESPDLCEKFLAT